MKHILLLAAVLASARGFAQQPDLVIADFEGPAYGDWKTTGTAFGDVPSKRPSGRQQMLGIVGQQYATSKHGDDAATGTLTSPPFKIERPYLQFFAGGGKSASINLLVDDKVVRTATGHSSRWGDTENLDQFAWDVSEFLGKTAIIRLVDESTRGWGHISGDQIVQSERKVASAVPDATREFVAEKRYLNIPVKDNATRRSVALLVDGKPETDHSIFRVGLADGTPDWWAAYEISHLKGKKFALKVDLLPGNSTALSGIEQSDEIKDGRNIYQGSSRPQLYFSPQRGGCGDANGLVYYEGEYHLFFQHNPFFADGGINSHWGHAISTDLVHWKQMPDALRPDDLGVEYSGSCVVDVNNTTGLQTGKEKPIIAVYTSQGRTVSQCAAYSNDRGRTWVKYAGNPILSQKEPGNRDPKVLWHEPTRKWVMVICYGWPGDQTSRVSTNPNYGFYTSPDLKNWERTCTINVDNATDCPEFFEISVDGDKAKTKWIFYTGNGTYLIGSFDGKVFTQEFGPYKLDRGGNFYASQTFNNIPEADGRRILMAHCSGGGNGTGFWGGISMPVELTLRSTDVGLQLYTYPVRELEKLRVKTHEIAPQPLKAGVNPLADFGGELLEVVADVVVGDVSKITFDLRGVAATYDATKQEFSCHNRTVPLKPVDGRIRLRAYVDRAAIMLFPNNGGYYMPLGASPSPSNLSLKLSAQGDGAKIQSLQVHELKSIWK